MPAFPGAARLIISSQTMKKCPECNRSFDDSVEACIEDGTPLVSDIDPLVGTLLANRFLITEKIAQGGMGAVYKAVQVKIDRVCAIKVLNPAAVGMQSAESRFNREAQMASRIDSPHAVTIYDFGEAEGGAFFLAMEYVDGLPLSKLLELNRTIPLGRAGRIVRQIAEALAAAHALDIIHRDLKPDNIMITKKSAEIDYVKVLDFGIAKTMADDAREKLTRTGFVLGTPVYMSPEQISGVKLDARSDVYGLALIAYEMLCGRLPFEGENSQAIMIKRVTDDPIPLRRFAPSMSDAVEQAVMAGLERDRNLRTPTVERFADELEAACSSPRAAETLGGRLGRETVPESPPYTVADQDSDALNRGKTEGSARTVGDYDKTLPAPFPPPAAYVTRSSSSIGAEDDIAPRAAPTVRMEGAQSGATTPQFRLTQPYGIPMSPQEQSVGGGREKVVRRRRRVTLIAVILVILAGAGSAAYYRFFREPGTELQNKIADSGSGKKVENPDANATSSAEADLAAAAERYYQSGLEHQNKAYDFQQANHGVKASEEHNKAIEEYRRAVVAKPTYPEAHENLGVSLYYTGRMETAIQQYRIAIAQYEESGGQSPSHIYVNLALALFDTAQYSEAAKAFGSAMERDPADYELVAHRGFALQNGGDRDAAQAAYGQYLQLAPSGRYAPLVRKILDGRSKPPVASGNR